MISVIDVNNHWQIKHFESMTDFAQNSLNQLVGALKGELHDVVPFVGAGLPAAYGVPDWTSFLLGLAANAEMEPEIKKLLAVGQFEEAAQAIQNHEHMEHAFPSQLEQQLGVISQSLLANSDAAPPIIPMFQSDCVITTNFDSYVERVFEEYRNPFGKIILGPACDVSSELNETPLDANTLIKLHGTASNKNFRVLTYREYEKHYISDGEFDIGLPTPGTLERLSSSRRLLFVGCSLQQDRFLTVLQKGPVGTRRHFAIVAKPDDDVSTLQRCLLYTSPSPRDRTRSRMPSSA